MRADNMQRQKHEITYNISTLWIISDRISQVYLEPEVHSQCIKAKPGFKNMDLSEIINIVIFFFKKCKYVYYIYINFSNHKHNANMKRNT